MKKLLTVFVAVMLLMVSLPIQQIQAQQVFTDVSPKHSNYEHINYLLSKNVVSATSKKYGVSEIVTREEVAVMVAKARQLNGTPRQTAFSDVPKSNPNSGYIQSAVEAGIIKGYPDGTFKPKTKVTRGHMAAFIGRAFDLPKGTKTFKDVKKGSTAYEAVSQLVAAGITTGYTDGTFKPNNNLTRGHISAFLARAMQYQEKVDDQSPRLAVHYIDVGQGDATLIVAPNGKTMLIDGGKKEYGDDIVAYLKSINITKLDYVVATHPDADHIGGLIEVVKSVKVGQFINSGKSHTTVTYEQLLTAIDQRNISYQEPVVGQKISLDSQLVLQVLAVNKTTSDNNEASIVLKLTYGEKAFLFMGDAGTEIEQQIAVKYNVSAAVLKAGHHGSSTSSSLSFLQKVQPQAVILSYGKDNDYGHPHNIVLKNVKAVGASVYSTATEGTIVIKTNGKTISISAKPFENPNESTTVGTLNSGVSSNDVHSGTYVIPGAPTSFKNCTALKEYYPSGVKNTHPAYSAARDGDKDGWACES